ncbi:MAG: methylmalonyl Co-A mutase-associated GTPase MeaB [Candidatus Nanopelagicales bacterium]|nr:methylmalonyl Co-A mutase-associated GTPase MeaB [Candidatus Nanopelagicales bacterium]
MGKGIDPKTLVSRATSGDRLSLARLLSAVEERAAEVPELVRLLRGRTGRSHVIGVTGAPGVGKSTTTSALIGHWRSVGQSVAVIAVDPTSPFTGGALLGDRVRMTEHATDDGVFIRSMAARGRLGGLSAATPAAIRVLDACGFDVVVVETVGVGQSEVDIVSHADTVVVLVAPGSGDSIQAAKAGLLEIADVLVVNKSDRPGADSTARELRSVAELKSAGDWRPPVVSVSATEGLGIVNLAEEIEAHVAHDRASGGLATRRRERAAAEIRGLATEEFQRHLDGIDTELRGLAEDVAAGKLDSYSAADAALLRVGLGDE